jgi:sugar phosphate isomerase/epimerase
MPQKFRLKIAASSLLMNKYRIHDAVTVLGETGYDAIEIWSTDIEKQLESNKTSFEKIRNALFKNKMTGTIHGPTVDHESPDKTKYNLCSKNKKLRDRSIKKNLLALDFAHKLGFKIVVIHPGHKDKADDSVDKEYWDLQIDAFKKLAGKAERLNLDLAIELMEKRGKEFVTEPSSMLKIIKEINSEHAGITVDLTHAFTHGSDKPLEFLESSKGLIFHAHFSGYGEKKTHVPLHMSTIPPEYIDKALKKLTQYHAGWITIEGHLTGIMDDTKENEKRIAAMNLEYISKELKSLHLV